MKKVFWVFIMLNFSCFEDSGEGSCSSDKFNECANTDTYACKQSCLEKGDSCGRSCYAACEEKEVAKELFCEKELDCNLADHDDLNCYELCLHEISIGCYDAYEDAPSCMWCFESG